MAWYYCKSGGTATGDGGRYVSQKANNSWATEFAATSEYYDSIESAMNATTEPDAVDFIMLSNVSTFVKEEAINLTLTSAPESPISVYSVDDDAVQTYSAGASESTGGTNRDYIIASSGLTVAYNGIEIKVTDDLTASSSGSGIMFVNGLIRLLGTGDTITTPADGTSISLYNTNIISDVGTLSHLFVITNGGTLEMIGGSTSTTSGSLSSLVTGGTSGGMTVTFTGVDLSNHGSGTFLLGSSGGAKISDDIINIRIKDCKVNASVVFVQENFSSPTHKFLMTNSSSSSAAAEYQFFQKTWAGDVEDQDDTGIHRDESTAFSGGTKVSMKVTTNSDCSKVRPVIFDFPAKFSALSNASTDTIRTYFAVSNATTLTDGNVWAELIYPDGTNKQTFNYLSNRVTDLLSTGTPHTDDSGSSTWKNGGSDLTAHNEYRMDLDTSGDVGADSVPIIRIYVAEPDVTIYFDTTVDTVA